MMVASLLARHRQDLHGRVKLVFQPAEETMSGARRMIQEGAMQDPRPDRVIGFHLFNGLPVGKVGVRDGAIFASADEIKVVVKGKSAHGALPHLSVDAIAAASQAVTALQTLVSREVSPGTAAVVSFGTIRGGTAFNIIAGEVELTGTVRTFDEGLRSFLLGRIQEVFQGVAAAMRAEAELVHVNGCPPVVNDPQATAFVRRAAEAVVGKGNVLEVEPTTVGDDMALFLREAPGCYFLVGSANPGRALGGAHHSATFDFDEAALGIGAEVVARCALEYLR
ncbi:MAG: amidohydrolase [Chloroflexi bacterium]|nr:amidohydrolase [Chloroflexota bacterium]